MRIKHRSNIIYLVMKILLAIIIVIYSGYLLYTNFIKYPYRYVGYFYPDIENLEYWVESKPFKSVEACKEWVDEVVDQYADILAASGKEYDYNFDYECGKDCYKADPYNQGVTYTCHTSVN